MPVVINNGGELGFGNLAKLSSGANMVEPAAWDELKGMPAIQAHLASRRLVLGDDSAPAAPAKTKPDPVLPPSVDADGDGIVDLSALNAKDAAAMVAELEDAATIAEIVEGEERKTVLDAAHKRILELTDTVAE